MLVKHIMNTNVKTATRTTKIRDVAVLMCFNKISGVPVVEAGNRIIGLLSEKDILLAMYPKIDEFMLADQCLSLEELEHGYRDVLNLTVEELMTHKVYTVAPEEPILRAASVMFLHDIRRIPVAVDHQLVGIISIGDVHKAIFKENFDEQFHSSTQTVERRPESEYSARL